MKLTRPPKITALTITVAVIIAGGLLITLAGCAVQPKPEPTHHPLDICLNNTLEIAYGYTLSPGRYYFTRKTAIGNHYRTHPAGGQANTGGGAKGGVRSIRVTPRSNTTRVCLNTRYRGALCADVNNLHHCKHHRAKNQ